jgi:aminoglycoside 3-N-acetyltransferase
MLELPMGRQDNLTDPVHRRVTGRRLVRDLRRLGVQPGQTLLVHASVRSIGLWIGGPSVVVRALRKAVGPTGNVVVPTGTAENSLTSRAHQALIARMTDAEVAAYRRTMPGFSKDVTPSTTGALGEALRTAPGAVRSAHPQSSFAAIGPEAPYLMADHRLESHLGEYSPLAKLYQMEATVLLLGAGYQVCSAFHLAEYRYVESPPTALYSCAVLVNGQREWIQYKDVVLDDQDFGEIGKSLDSKASLGTDEASVKIGTVGNADSRLIPMVHAVDHARDWMTRHRV